MLIGFNYGGHGCSILTRHGLKHRRFSKRNLTHFVTHVEHGKPELLPKGKLTCEGR